MAFATLDEAWGVGGLSTADRVPRNRPKTRDKKGARGERKVRVLENIMDVYTADKRSEVTPDCHMAPYPSAHDVLPGFTTEFADVPLDDDDGGLFEDHKLPEAPVSACREDNCKRSDVAAPATSVAVSAIESFESPTSPAHYVTSSAISETGRQGASIANTGGDTFFLEMLMYVVSGILLIFMMEQFVRLGSNLRSRA